MKITIHIQTEANLNGIWKGFLSFIKKYYNLVYVISQLDGVRDFEIVIIVFILYHIVNKREQKPIVQAIKW